MTAVYLAGILAFHSVCLLGLVWFKRCNDQTFAERKRIADIVFAQVDWCAYLAELDAVEYGDHLRALFFRRDPKTLYSPELQRLMA